MRKTHVLLILASLMLIPNAAYAWGREGHQIIALIAAGELTPAARSQVGDLLSGPSAASAMERYSTWADEIRSQRRDTSRWHYVNIEIDSNGYSAARDCPHDDCVVGQINRDISILKDKTLIKPVRAEALRFLIHFVGDETQPLHCADNHDRGGNEVRVVLDGDRTNLHRIWDTEVVKALGSAPATVATQLSAQITPGEKAAWSKGTPASWANQSWAIAKHDVYADLPGTGSTDAPIALPRDYPREKSGIAARQLQRAGVRLAAILNKIFE